MPEKIAVVTDTTACLSPNELADLGVVSLPLVYIFDQQAFQDGAHSEEEFFQRLAEAKDWYTSGVTLISFLDAYQSLAASGTKQILSVHLSAWASSVTRSSAELAAEQMRQERGVEIEFWDSQSTSAGLAWQVRLAARMARRGAGLEEIKDAMSDLRSRIRLLAALDTLEYLRRGGRIGKAQALLGSVLGLKPILTLDEHGVSPVARPKTFRIALRKMVEIARSWGPLEQVAISSGMATDKADKLTALLAETGVFVGKIQRLPIAVVLGVHTGPGVVGFFAEQRKRG